MRHLFFVSANAAAKKTKLIKSLSFKKCSESVKRKADLFEVPTFSKKLKTENWDPASSTENLILKSWKRDIEHSSSALWYWIYSYQIVSSMSSSIEEIYIIFKIDRERVTKKPQPPKDLLSFPCILLPLIFLFMLYFVSNVQLNLSLWVLLVPQVAPFSYNI